jgi:hypothetical protein
MPYRLRARIWGTAGEAGLQARRGLRERRIDGRGGIAGSGRGTTFHSIDGLRTAAPRPSIDGRGTDCVSGGLTGGEELRDRGAGTTGAGAYNAMA